MNINMKYSRTFHAPWSKGATNDDKIANDVSSLLNVPIIISEKIDGGNASLEFSGCFARTHASVPTHPSFDHLKALHNNVKYKIPKNIQLFGENVFAKHSIEYSELPGYFLLFNVREIEPEPIWLSWEEVEMWAEEIQVPTVPVLFRGVVETEGDLKKITENFMIQNSCCGGIREGVVIRLAKQFSNQDFSKSVLKVVRVNHVSPDNDHWMHKEIVKNKLKIF